MTQFTRQQWLNLLPPDIRAKAMKAIKEKGHEHCLQDSCSNFAFAIITAFTWDETEEGGAFWSSVANKDWGTPTTNELVATSIPYEADEETTDSQNKAILAHLEEGLTLTPLEALKLFNCFRLSARIHDLRAKGHPIVTTMVSDGRKRYATYSINVNGTSDN